MINDQLTLDLDDSFTINSSSYAITTPTISNGTITTGTTFTDNWTSGITLGGTTLTEEKVKVLDDMKEWMSSVDEKLAILKPNPDLEDRWEELKSLREQYIELEKDLLNKEKVWDIIKK